MNVFTRLLGVSLTAVLVGSIGCASVEPTAGESNDEAVASATLELGTAACPADVPAALAPPAGQTLKEILSGVGVQIYMCTGNATGYAWTFVAPQANLLDDCGKLIGTHFIGPTWQGNDGSTVVGQRVAGAVVDPTAVPWLLLNGVSHATNKGRFSNVTSIQRLSTVGGLAPTDGCDATHVGSLAQVPYTAEYAFYKAKARGAVKVCGG